MYTCLFSTIWLQLLLVAFAGCVSAERLLLVNGEFIDTLRSDSVLSEWSDDWFSLMRRPVTRQWFVQINQSVDTRVLESQSGLKLSLYFPHNGYLLVSSQV